MVYSVPICLIFHGLHYPTAIKRFRLSKVSADDSDIYCIWVMSEYDSIIGNRYWVGL